MLIMKPELIYCERIEQDTQQVAAHNDSSQGGSLRAFCVCVRCGRNCTVCVHACVCVCPHSESQLCSFLHVFDMLCMHGLYICGILHVCVCFHMCRSVCFHVCNSM